MRKNPRTTLSAGAVLAALLALSAPARGGTFDPATGTVSTGDAAISYSFDSLAALPGALQMTAWDANSSPIDVSTLEFAGPAHAIEGAGDMMMGGTVMFLSFSFTHPEALLGHRSHALPDRRQFLAGEPPRRLAGEWPAARSGHEETQLGNRDWFTRLQVPRREGEGSTGRLHRHHGAVGVISE